MKQKKLRSVCIGLCLLAAFAIWTFLLGIVDVQPIGPQGTSVGFATLNRYIHEWAGVNMDLYTLTDWLGLVPLGFVFGFGLLGLVQWIHRKHILKVDRSILILGGFYLIVMVLYLSFEWYVVNYRPVLVEGRLEASYPSSTTMLVICVLSTAITQFNDRMRSGIIKRCVTIFMILFIVFIVAGRLVSGVHWFSDIVGGILLSAGLVMLYHSVVNSGVTA